MKDFPSLFTSYFCLPPGVSANLCRVTGGVLGIHWSSIIGLGWHPLADGRGGATCWESCCLKPNCNAVWSLGGRCVLLSCSRKRGCPISSLPQPHQESLGLFQLLSKVWLLHYAFSNGTAIDNFLLLGREIHHIFRSFEQNISMLFYN